MKPRPKLRRIVKWGATSLTVVLLALWVVSGWGGPTYCDGPLMLGWSNGQFVVDWTFADFPPTGQSTGWSGGSFAKGYKFDWRLYGEYYGTFSDVEWKYYSVTGWALALIPAFPAALLWRSDWLAGRRRLQGHCKKCNYDRRGLAADATCPECGELGLR